MEKHRNVLFCAFLKCNEIVIKVLKFKEVLDIMSKIKQLQKIQIIKVCVFFFFGGIYGKNKLKENMEYRFKK